MKSACITQPFFLMWKVLGLRLLIVAIDHPVLHAQLLSLVVQKVGGRPGMIYHVMCAADVPTLKILFS